MMNTVICFFKHLFDMYSFNINCIPSKSLDTVTTHQTDVAAALLSTHSSGNKHVDKMSCGDKCSEENEAE